jgi:signal transduction histidine kinase
VSASPLSPHPIGRRVGVAGQLRARAQLLGRGRWMRQAMWPLGVTVAIAGLTASVRDGGIPGYSIALSVLAGSSFLFIGLIGWGRRPRSRAGALMVAVGVAWFVPTALRLSDAAAVLTVAQVVSNAWFIIFTLLLVTFPSGRVSGRRDAALVWSVFVVTVPLQVAWLLFLPAPGNVLVAWPDQGIADAIDGTQRIVFLVVVTVLAVALVRRWLGGSRPLRRVLSPVLAGALAAVLFGLIVLLQKLGEPLRTAADVFFIVFAAVPLVFLVGMLRSRLARSAVGDLLVDLREPAAHGVLRDALARALGDPSLEVAYWVPEYAGYVDADGRSAPLPIEGAAQVATLVERRGVRVAALVHDASLREEPELVGAVCAAAGIALENERLQADLRARLEELRGSRARLVEAGDAARRRLERDLHDGEQQRLVSLSVALRLVATRLGPDTEEALLLAGAHEELRCSLTELRDLAQGIHPAVLSDHGLAVALESLAARAPLPVRLEAEVPTRPPARVEVAAYYLVTEALTNVAKYARASQATVNLSLSAGTLVVEVADDGAGGADPRRGTGLRGLADRVEALDGRLQVTSRPGEGTTVRAELPCG